MSGLPPPPSVNQHLQRGLRVTRSACITPLLAFELKTPPALLHAPAPYRCSSFWIIHAVQMLLNSRSQHGRPWQESKRCSCSFLWIFRKESKTKEGSGDFQRSLKALDPDEQQQRGDADGGTAADVGAFHRVWGWCSQSKEEMRKMRN